MSIRFCRVHWLCSAVVKSQMGMVKASEHLPMLGVDALCVAFGISLGLRCVGTWAVLCLFRFIWWRLLSESPLRRGSHAHFAFLCFLECFLPLNSGIWQCSSPLYEISLALHIYLQIFIAGDFSSICEVSWLFETSRPLVRRSFARDCSLFQLSIVFVHCVCRKRN